MHTPLKLKPPFGVHTAFTSPTTSIRVHVIISSLKMTSERNETPLGVFGADEMGVQRKSSFRVVRSPTPLEMDGRVSRQDSLSGTREYVSIIHFCMM